MIAPFNEDKDIFDSSSQVLQGPLGRFQTAPSDRSITAYVWQSGLNVIPHLKVRVGKHPTL